MTQDQLIKLLKEPNFAPTNIKLKANKLFELVTTLAPNSNKHLIVRISGSEYVQWLKNFFDMVFTLIPDSFETIINQPFSQNYNIAIESLYGQGSDSLLYFLNLVALKAPNLLYKFITTPSRNYFLGSSLVEKGTPNDLKAFFQLILENIKDSLEEILLLKDDSSGTIGDIIAKRRNKENLELYFDLITYNIPNSISKFVTLKDKNQKMIGHHIAKYHSAEGVLFYLNYVAKHTPKSIPQILTDNDENHLNMLFYIANNQRAEVFISLLDFITEHNPELLEATLSVSYKTSYSKNTTAIEAFVSKLSSSGQKAVLQTLKQPKYNATIQLMLKSPNCLSILAHHFPEQANVALFNYLLNDEKELINKLFNSKFTFNFDTFKRYITTQSMTEHKKIKYRDNFDALLNARKISARMHEAVIKVIDEVELSKEIEPTEQNERQSIEDCCLWILNSLFIHPPKHASQPELRKLIADVLNPENEDYIYVYNSAICFPGYYKALHDLYSWKVLPFDAQNQAQHILEKTERSDPITKKTAEALINSQKRANKLGSSNNQSAEPRDPFDIFFVERVNSEKSDIHKSISALNSASLDSMFQNNGSGEPPVKHNSNNPFV